MLQGTPVHAALGDIPRSEAAGPHADSVLKDLSGDNCVSSSCTILRSQCCVQVQILRPHTCLLLSPFLTVATLRGVKRGRKHSDRAGKETGLGGAQEGFRSVCTILLLKRCEVKPATTVKIC